MQPYFKENRLIKTVIFDLDGTLLYTLDSISLSCNKVLEAHRLPPVTHEQLKRFVGDGVIDLMRRAFAAGGSNETVDDSVVAEFRACFKDDCDYRVKAYDGINELIARLKEQHIFVACNTNKPHENAVKLIHKHFADDFDAVQGQESGIPKKPDATGALRIAQTLGVKPQEVVYIGDSDVDMFTAKNASFHSIGAAWGYRGAKELKSSGAEFIAHTPYDVIQFLKMQVS